jgi:DNA invertase Pin-like site-specific DNA recombinase
VENPAGDQLWVDGGSPPGDVVTVTGIDRRARSTLDLCGIVKRIADAKAQFRSLAEP